MLTEYLCYYNVLRNNTEKNTKDSPLVLLLFVYTNIVSLVVSSPLRLAAKIASPHCSAIVGRCCVAQTCSYLAVVKVWAFMFVLSAVSGRLAPTDSLGSCHSAFIRAVLQDGEFLRSKQVSGSEPRLIH